MTIIDMFGGVGGFSLAARWCNHECVGYYENDRSCVSVYNRNFGISHSPTDVRQLKPADVPDHDILCAGFPCQDVSVAGKHAGLAGSRTGLFSEIIRVASEKRPKHLLLENVKGLLGSHGGWDFARILSALDEIGYDVEWSILNASDLVPQNRERVFIVGHSRAEPIHRIFPISGSNLPPAPVNPQTVNCLDANYHKGPDNHSQRTLVAPILTPFRPEKRQQGRRMKTDGEPSFTLSAQDRHGVCIDYSQIRRLTPLECERLMGFPDGWTATYSDGKPVPDTVRYRMMGNAVVPCVVQAVMERML